MNRLNELYAEQRRADEIREAQREADKIALLQSQSNKTNTPPRRVRQAVGGKLIEWGKRLQDQPRISAAPSTNH